MEKRKHPRFAVQFPIAFAPEGTQWWGEALNISLGGCAVASDGTVTTGARIRLHLYLPGNSTPVTVERAPVRWTAFGRFGVEFIGMETDAYQRLSRFVSAL